MKRKFVFAFMVVLLCSMPIYLTGKPIIPNLKITVRVLVDTDGQQWIDDMVKGHILSALREIPDVKVVGNNEMFTISVVPEQHTNKMEYFGAWLVSVPHSFQPNKNLPPINTCFVSDLVAFSTPSHTLKEHIRSLVARLDARTFQPLREGYDAIKGSVQ